MNGGWRAFMRLLAIQGTWNYERMLGVGMGYALHAGQVVCCDGTKEMDARIERVLTCDPGLGVARHADAGYPSARAVARRRGVRIPMAARRKSS